MIDKKLLSILVCPVSKAALEYLPEQQELICWASGLAYPIRDGIPVMLENEARILSLEEKAKRLEDKEKRLEEKEKHQAATNL